MSRNRLVPLAIGVAVALAACGPRETWEQSVTRVRGGYRIEPMGFRGMRDDDGSPVLDVDVLVVNTGRVSLRWLTLLVHVQGPDGRDRLARRAPVDVAMLLPGVTAGLTAVVRGVDLNKGENVLLELEGEPPQDALAEYPEYGSDRRGMP